MNTPTSTPFSRPTTALSMPLPSEDNSTINSPGAYQESQRNYLVNVRKTKILLVDDRRENLVALENLVVGPDVEILSAISANDALALLLEHEFALALLDVQMPEINGFELARIMRSVERSRGIPIIFVTASQSGQRDIFEGYEKGAVDYLLKPLDAHIVRSKVKVFVELDQKSRFLEQQLHEMVALRELAESANHAKSRFLANMSHEIRTPLGAIIGFAELLKTQDQSAEDKANFVNAIMRNGELLLQIVNDVLDLSKIEAEKVEIERNQTMLAELMNELKTVHAHSASEKGIGFAVTTSGSLPRTIVTDALRLKQILHNIVGNAVKFTSRGEVTIDISFRKSSRGDGGKLVFAVKDTGCGLSPVEAERIFQPFMQADGSTTRRYGGTGLGLVIAKQLATLLGGDVVLFESEPGVGATFVITIDPGPVVHSSLVDGKTLLQKKPTETTSRSIPFRLEGVRVLVVDDAKDNRHLMSRILSLAGAQVETASDGSEAIEKTLAGNFDVVLMDIQMPGTDGYQATTSLRSQGYKKPIIALTAHAMKEDLVRCLEVGCNEHLSKPVDHRNLIASIEKYLTKN